MEYVGLQEQPFRRTGMSADFIQYRSQQKAFTFLRDVLAEDQGVGLLYGPKASGKSTLVRQFVQELPTGVAVAVVDGARLKTPNFLSTVLAQFGYEVTLQSSDELLSMLSVFLVQQTRSHQAPVLVLENMNKMYPSALLALCKLAVLSVHTRYALRIILVGDNPLQQILESPGLRNVAERLAGSFELGPLTSKETLIYLYTKAESYGIKRPDNLFPVDTCDKLHLASGGLPGELEGIAMSVIERAAGLTVDNEPVEVPVLHDEIASEAGLAVVEAEASDNFPSLMVTCNGEMLQEIVLDGEKALIGRSILSDVRITNQYISKHHALLIKVDDAIHIVDLNSRNGTHVNSRLVSSTVLWHEDIISIGDHRIKILYPSGHANPAKESIDLADTASMKNITDMREQKAAQDSRLSVVTRTGNLLD